jgi:hypothetical protein
LIKTKRTESSIDEEGNQPINEEDDSESSSMIDEEIP